MYGSGANVRDWIYVDDHAEAVWQILQRGKKGETYDVGGKTELSNLELLNLIIELLNKENLENTTLSFVLSKTAKVMTIDMPSIHQK